MSRNRQTGDDTPSINHEPLGVSQYFDSVFAFCNRLYGKHESESLLSTRTRLSSW